MDDIGSSRLQQDRLDDLVSMAEAMATLSRDERFHATVYAMNKLLVQKGIYSPEEFEFQFRQWAHTHGRLVATNG
jgi:hypothetical protein